MLRVASAIILLLTFAGHAQAALIGFEGTSGEILPGNPTTESGFVYDAFSGGIYVEPFLGNPSQRMSGGVAQGGGVMQVVRDDGGLFLFDQVDITQNFTQNFGGVASGPFSIIFEGYLSGVLQQTDTLIPSNTADEWLTVSAVGLSGIIIDELRVLLDATSSPLGADHIDNLVLTRVPEPATLALFGLGLAGIPFVRRRRTPT